MGRPHLLCPETDHVAAGVRTGQPLGAAGIAFDRLRLEQAALGEPADQWVDLALAGVEIADRRQFVDLGDLVGGDRLLAQHQRQQGAFIVGEVAVCLRQCPSIPARFRVLR